MNPRDLLRRTLEFRSPPSIPRHAWISPWADAHHRPEVARLKAEFPDDILTSPARYAAPLPVVGSPYRKGTYIDEWGCRFTNVHDGVLGIVREPLIADWGQLDEFRPPAATLAVDRDAVNRFCSATDRFVLAGALVRPFERLTFIRTLEQALVDLLQRPPQLVELLRRIHQHYLEEVEAWSQTAVDAIVLMDDWGAQTRMVASPDVCRRLFLPFYAEYCEVARRYGKYVFMHADGHILEIVEDLINVGVSALNSQIDCMGVAELGRRFAGRLTFWGEVDRHLLASGTVEDVRRAVAEAHAHLYAGGGVIAQCEFGPGARPENVFEVFRAWNRITGAKA